MFDPDAAGPGLLPIAKAYWAFEEAQQALASHADCRVRRVEQPYAFRHFGDERPIVVWTRQPACLTVEMGWRGCAYDGPVRIDRHAAHCPRTLEDMPW